MPELDIEAFCLKLDWRQFEALAQRAFQSFGYQVFNNYRMKKPRIEIDLVACKNGMTFAADCKHWKMPKGKSSMLGVSIKQAERAKHLVGRRRDFKKILPLVITMREENLGVLENGVPVVSVAKLSDFILNFESCSEEFLILSERDEESLSSDCSNTLSMVDQTPPLKRI